MPFLEDALIIELKNKNELALKQLYNDNYSMVVKLVVNNSGTEQEAKDIYQEAIIHFYERLSQNDFVLTCKIKTFLYAVCRNLWMQNIYRQNKQVRLSVMQGLPDVEEELSDLERKEKEFEAMESSLGKLGEPCRTLLEDFYLRSFTMEALTEKFGYTNTDNTKTQKYKCLQRLKRFFFEVDK
jgi:RNA polymerase sigma factor (sigma-70 family)